MFKINDFLATHGLEAQWGSDAIDDMIAKPDSEGKIEDFKVFDIREKMLDARNPLEVYQTLTEEAITMIKEHCKIVICCSAGISRSNAIAVSVLMKYFDMSLPQALVLVREKVPIANPLPCHKGLERLYCL